MELTITIIQRVGLKSFVFVCLSFFLLNQVSAQSTPINAAIIAGQDNVDFSANAIDGNLSTKAVIRASSGILVTIGAYSGFLELQFPSTLPANTTSYVKIDTDDNLLPSLLGGSLGGLLSDVAGAVLIGNQEFTVQAKNNTTVVLEGNSQIANDFASNSLKIVVNAQNEYFIALTPSQPYNRIRVTNRVGSLLGLGNTKHLGVYGAFYIGTPDTCGIASYTSFSGSGLNLDLLNLGGAGVTNPNFVLDSNPNNFSKLSLGILAVAASIEQSVYFDRLSETTDQFYIRLKVDPSLLALGIVNNINITASNNSTVVQTVNLNSLLNLDLLTLLQGNQVVTIPFSPNGAVNKVTVRYNSLLNVQLTQSLDLYDIKRLPPKPTITDLFTLSPKICSGSSAALAAETVPGTVINWYSQAVGGIALATTNSGAPFVTGSLTQNTSFYAAAMRTGCSEESLRVRVNVSVVSVPVADDISIASNINACNGFVVLSPWYAIGGGVFRYYKDQLKTQEITTGYAGDAGVTYAINALTGQLTISGLTAVNSPYTYYISVTVEGLCENEINTLKTVTVTYSSGLTLQVSPTIQGCGSVNLVNAILNFDTSSDIQYAFFDSSNTPITAEAASNITISGTYFIQSTSLLGSCASTLEQVIVTVHPMPTLSIPNTNLVTTIGNSVILNATSDTTITWYDSNGNALPSNIAGPFATAGFYTFTAIASNGNCSKEGTVYVTVIDATNCPILTERVYADMQSWGSILTGGVFDASDAIDHNPQTFSTIVTGLGLLGIGTTWQTLQWNNTIQAGTPVTVKLGSEYSGLILAGAYSIVGTKRNTSGVPIDIGFIQLVSGSFVDLLPGENSFEYTFVPSDNTGPKAYDGVRIIVGSLASIAQNVKIYEAYYNNQVTQIACSPNDVKDVLSGVVDLGIGAATALVGVNDPFDAVDSSLTSHATMYAGAGILAAADLTVTFMTPTLENDWIEIMMSNPSNVLDLSLLSGFTIQMYLGETPVGAVLDNNSPLVSLYLLNAGAEAMLIIKPQPMIYDRIRIRYGGVAVVLGQLYIHDINRKADTSVINADTTNTVEVCSGETIQLQVVPPDCVTFIWYDAPTGGNVVSTGTSFTIPTTVPPGSHDYYIQPVRFGCEVYDRGKVTVIVGATVPQNAITQVQINGNTATNLCSQTGIVTLVAELNLTLSITNPIFYWYSFDGTAQQLIANENTATLVISSLTPGTYTYFVGISSDEYCPIAEADRTQVTFTILPLSQPAVITANDALFCLGNDAVITPTTTLLNPQFFWFLSNDNSQPILDGSVIVGVTYAIYPSGSVAVSGVSGCARRFRYYVGLSCVTTCLNQAGNFKPVAITISGGTTPTTNNTTQNFCLINNPTIANIQVNEPNVTWYSNQNGGTALAATTVLADGGIYYGSMIDGSGCESSVRLAVTVNVSGGTTPTTNNVTQAFCLVNNPTLASIQVNEPNVSWYSSANNGAALLSSTPLADGGIYYASIIDGFGCESSIRLMVTIDFFDVTTATITGGSTQSCAFNQVTYSTNSGMSNYVWTITGGTIISGGQSTDDFVTVSWENLGAATVGVDFTDSCSAIASAAFNLTVISCSDLTITKTVNDPTPAIDDNITFTIIVTNEGDSQLLDVVVSEVLPSGYSFVSATSSAGSYNNATGIWNIPLITAKQSATLSLIAKVLSSGNYTNTATINTSSPVDSDPGNNLAEVTTYPLCLVIYNEFSPNNDDSNEYFHIDCIENYPNNKLEVFNRYGVLVYSKNRYINDWDGTANVSGTVNKEDKLPTGTYYFILDVGENNIKKNGWLSITR
jgi:uncharacterized repeat protein (TIGR01451 family)/gliding motility-associated-like protein